MNPETAKRIAVAGPSISELEVQYVLDAVQHGWYQHAVDYIRRFEQSFADMHGVEFALALPSCTAGIHLALAGAGIGPGDEVIVPEVTWIASSAPVSYVGATPIFADVEPNWCLSVDSVQRCLTASTRAIIAVDLYGDLPDMGSLRQLASDENLLLIEDAAQAIGSTLGPMRAGAFGDVGVFSFHGSKTMTTGEGGMLITRDGDLFERIQTLSDHGRRPGDKSFLNDSVGFKYRMSNLQAALGLAQLSRLGELVEKKQQIHSWYKKHLAAVDVGLVDVRAEVNSSYWMVCAVDSSCGRDKHEWIRRLAEVGIDCRPVFSPLSSLPAYADFPTAKTARDRNHVAYSSTASAINLPSALSLTESDVAEVAERL